MTVSAIEELRDLTGDIVDRVGPSHPERLGYPLKRGAPVIEQGRIGNDDPAAGARRGLAVENVPQPLQCGIASVHVVAALERLGDLERIADHLHDARLNARTLQRVHEQRSETANARVLDDEQRCIAELCREEVGDLSLNLAASAGRQTRDFERAPVPPTAAELIQQRVVVRRKGVGFPMTDLVASSGPHQRGGQLGTCNAQHSRHRACA